ncbi:glutathione S-transferase N-terminal domain-containing protein [Beggiatoa alba]|nr:glutathione S-transferase N-terminal domain-containing protein [Beggiatoa alba]
MKLFFKYFFKTIRIILGPIILFINFITLPKGIQRPAEQQKQVDSEAKSLTLYQFKTCPFCIKVKRMIKRLSLNIEMLDAQYDALNRNELLSQGGKIAVPCLKITDLQGKTTWMYESSTINQYLQQRFA